MLSFNNLVKLSDIYYSCFFLIFFFIFMNSTVPNASTETAMTVKALEISLPKAAQYIYFMYVQLINFLLCD